MVDDDLEPLITRCPNCNTQFRVTESQLTVASGRVRCGACLTVFQGIDHLVLDQESPFASGSEADAALDALLEELGPEKEFDIGRPGRAGAADPFRVMAEPTEPETRFYGGHEEVADTREVDTVSPSRTDEAEAPDEKVRLEPAEEPDPEVFHPDFQVVDDADQEEMEVTADEPAAPAVDDDLPDVEDEEPETEPPPPASEEDYERWIGRTASIDQLVEEVVASGRASVHSRSGQTAVTEVPDSPAEEDTRDNPFSLEPDGGISFAPEPRRWWAGGLAAGFLVLLAAQIAYLQFPDWSREPGLRPAYAWICGWLGCELPEMRALDALRTRNLVVRSHPNTGGALVVDAAIVNLAPYAQRFPDLELRFTSATGELVAGRRFKPDEYLPVDFEGERVMPPETPIQVSLEIVDPGPDAVNYTLSFR